MGSIFYCRLSIIPLLIIWKNKLTPRTISNKSHSLVDIFPTILDLIGEEQTISSVGTSILSNKESTALLVQPYNGIMLGVVEWPYKLVWQRKSDRKTLYNLATDPLETTPVKNPDISTRLWNKMDLILFSEQFFSEGINHLSQSYIQ